MNPLTCRELVELVTAYLDGALDPDTEARVARHLAHCPGCTQYVEQFRWTVAALGELPPEGLSPDVEAALHEAFREWHGGAGTPG